LNLLIEQKERISLGTIITVSGEQAILDHNKIRFNNPVFDMETLGVAQAASSHKIPVFSIRGVTHNLATGSQNNLHSIIDYTWHYDRNAAMRKLLIHPWFLFKLFNYLRLKIRVCNHLASTLFSLLQLLSLDDRKDYEDLDYRI